MFLDPRSVEIWIYRKSVDCRKGHHGLAQLVVDEVKGQLKSGSIFLFVSRDRKTAKALRFDGSGLTVSPPQARLDYIFSV